jgi:hypothetical protein
MDCKVKDGMGRNSVNHEVLPAIDAKRSCTSSKAVEPSKGRPATSMIVWNRERSPSDILETCVSIVLSFNVQNIHLREWVSALSELISLCPET